MHCMSILFLNVVCVCVWNGGDACMCSLSVLAVKLHTADVCVGVYEKRHVSEGVMMLCISIAAVVNT